MTFARALFANKAESEDELSFLKDDILEVLEHDYEGMQGWWLCKLKGNKGIAPANRLIIISKECTQNDYDSPKCNYESESTRINILPEKSRPKTVEVFMNDLPQDKALIKSSRPQTTEYLLTEDYDVPAVVKFTHIPFQVNEFADYDKPITKLSPSSDSKYISITQNAEYDAPDTKNNRQPNSSLKNITLQDNMANTLKSSFKDKHVTLLNDMDYDTPSSNKRNTSYNNLGKLKSSLKDKHVTLLNDMDYDMPSSDERNTSYNNLANQMVNSMKNSTYKQEDYDMPKSSLKTSQEPYKNVLQEDYDTPKSIRSTMNNLSTNRFTNESVINQDYDLPQANSVKKNEKYSSHFTNGSQKLVQDNAYDLPKKHIKQVNMISSHEALDYDRPTSRYVLDSERGFRKAENRDSFLAEYDVPAERSDTSMKFQNVRTTNSEEHLLKQNNNTILDTDKYIINVDPMNLIPFNSSYKEVMNVVNQLPLFAEKWQELKNIDARPSIVKMVSVNIWNKLQACITHAAKLTANVTERERLDVIQAFNKVKESNNSLELILDFLNNYNKIDPDKHEATNYITQLLTVSNLIESSLADIKSLFEAIKSNYQLENKKISGQVLKSSTKNVPKNIHSSFESLDYDKPNSKMKNDSYRVKSYDGILEYNNNQNANLNDSKAQQNKSTVSIEENLENIIYRTKSLEISLDDRQKPVKRSESRYSAILMRPFHLLANREKRNAMLLDGNEPDVTNSRHKCDNQLDTKAKKRKENKQESGLLGLRKKFRSLSRLF